MKTLKQYLAEAEQTLAPPAPAPAPAPAPVADFGGNVLDVETTPEVDAFIETNTIRDAEGDVDMAATFGQMMTKVSGQMDVKGLQDALAQANIKLDNFEKDPEFLTMSPEDQAEFKQNLPEIKKILKELVDTLVKLQHQFATGGQQMTDLSKTTDYQQNNPMKGVKSFVPAQQPAPATVQEDAELARWRKIAGLT
jgi:hypothetical protein